MEQLSYFTQVTCGGHIICDPQRCRPYYVHFCLRIDPCDGSCEVAQKLPWPERKDDFDRD